MDSMLSIAMYLFTSHVQPFAPTAPLSMGCSRQENWSRLPFPSQGDHPNPGIKPKTPAFQADSLQLSHLGSLHCSA